MKKSVGLVMVALVVVALVLPAPASAGGLKGHEWALIGIGAADLIFNQGGILREAVSLPGKVFGQIFGGPQYGPPVVYGQPVQYQPTPYPVHGQPPVVYNQPGAVMLPSAGYVPEGYETRQFRAMNNTKGVIFVRTPRGLHRLEPGGEVEFFDNVSTGAGGAFYAVHAMATVQVPGGYRSQWAHTFTSNNGSLIWTAEFRDYSWGDKIVPAYAATRYEITPPDAVQGAPGVQAPPVPPQSSSAGPQSYVPPAVPPQAGADELTRLRAENENLRLRLKELEKARDPLTDSK